MITERELTRVGYLYRRGYTNAEIVNDINSTLQREAGEYYDQCILEEHPNE